MNSETRETVETILTSTLWLGLGLLVSSMVCGPLGVPFFIAGGLGFNPFTRN